MSRVHISELQTLRDRAGNFATEETDDPATLCANWRYGCNRVTDGPDKSGHLSLCDDCAKEEKETD